MTARLRSTVLEDLPEEHERAVVINVGTDMMATLAAASVLRHASMPLLVINCSPTPESSWYFDRLASQWGFDVLERPLLNHGAMLDWLFSHIRAEVVLLLDSDAELRSTEFIGWMRSHIGRPFVFGAGFIHGPTWLGEAHGLGPRMGLYQERPWIPCAMLRVSDVRKALAAGLSFSSHLVFNDFSPSRLVSKVLGARFLPVLFPGSWVGKLGPGKPRRRDRAVAWVRRRGRNPYVARLASARLPWLAWCRREYYGLRPNIVCCDTGADVYQWCKYQQGKIFAGVAVELLGDEVAHYHGVTRRDLDPGESNATLVHAAEPEVRDRLRTIYGLDWDELWSAGETGVTASPSRSS